jgi:hypothetical protein
LPANDVNDYKVTITRWPYYTWIFSAGLWRPTLHKNTTVEYLVTNATDLTLTAAQIRTAQLYEFSAPNVLNNSGSSFSQVAGSYISSNATQNQQIVDIGYDSFVAFKYLDIMVQQKTSLTTASGYGPGRTTRVVIQDT